MKKGKMGGNNKWLAVGVAGLLIVGGIYYVSNSTGNLTGNNKQVGAVAASASGVVKGAVSASASSPQPVITVTSWPSFNMKYDTAGSENNLVVKADYSVTAKGGKIYTPAGWGLMSVRNTLDQDAGGATKVEVTALDTVATASCYWQGVVSACYVIPEGKTIRFTVKQTYNPKVMFGGVYTAKLTNLYFLPGTNGQLYYSFFPGQTSKLDTVTVVGEKSPYLYTTSLEVNVGDNITLKGIRLNGSKPIIEGYNTPFDFGYSDTSITITNAKLTPGVYRVYMSHPTYGNSNSAWVTVKAPTVLPTISLNTTNIAYNPTIPNVNPASLVGTITFNIVSNGGDLSHPTSYDVGSDFDVVFVSNSGDVINVNQSGRVEQVTPNDSFLPAGKPYTVSITGLLKSDNSQVLKSDIWHMEVVRVSSVVDGKRVVQYPKFLKTNSASLPK